MKEKQQKPKLIVVTGPTATGKSDLAVHIARQIGGEIISADSRQVYRGLDIGTGKITKREMRGVPHHLLDIADPKRDYGVSKYQKHAIKAARDIAKRGSMPILCGGTGYFIQAVVDNMIFPDVKRDPKLRKVLKAKSVAELASMLKSLDLRRWKEIDRNNPRRLIRAIEIASKLGKVPPRSASGLFDSLQIGIDLPDEVLKKRIEVRLDKRLRKGMVAEAKRLREGGLSFKRMNNLGLEYRHLASYLQGKTSREEMFKMLSFDIWHYAKRQRTWFRKDPRIKWFRPDQAGEITKEVRDFLAQ